MKKIIIVLIVLSFFSCHKSITGFYELRSSNITRLGITIDLKPDSTYKYYVVHHGYFDSIHGNWKLSKDTLSLTDNRKFEKKEILFLEKFDSTIFGSYLEIKSKLNNDPYSEGLINLNGIDTITDSEGKLLLQTKIDIIKTNKLIMGTDTSYKVKFGNTITLLYTPTFIKEYFILEDKWIIRKNKLIAVYRDNTKIILKKKKTKY